MLKSVVAVRHHLPTVLFRRFRTKLLGNSRFLKQPICVSFCVFKIQTNIDVEEFFKIVNLHKRQEGDASFFFSPLFVQALWDVCTNKTWLFFIFVGRLCYSRDFLIGLANCAQARKKPEFLPEHPIVLTEAVSLFRQLIFKMFNAPAELRSYILHRGIRGTWDWMRCNEIKYLYRREVSLLNILVYYLVHLYESVRLCCFPLVFRMAESLKCLLDLKCFLLQSFFFCSFFLFPFWLHFACICSDNLTCT